MDGAEVVKAALLGIVQGIAEFLPISSSGHLVILGELLDRALGEKASPSEGLQLNVALHFGTLLSILVVYRRELRSVLVRPWMCVAIVVATIPAAAVGLAFKDELESAFSTPLLAGCCLLVTAAMLAAGQRFGGNARPLEEMSQADALLVGLFQAVALLPGVSRSGSTISGGLLCGLKREAAAAFSFLIAIPAIGGATVLTAKDVWEASRTASVASSTVDGANVGNPESAAHVADPAPLIVGAAVSFLVGIASLRCLLRLIEQRRLHWFAWYCAVAGTLTIAWQAAERLS